MKQIVGKLTGTVEHLDNFVPDFQNLKEYKTFFDQLKRFMDRTERDWDKGDEVGRKEWRQT